MEPREARDLGVRDPVAKPEVLLPEDRVLRGRRENDERPHAVMLVQVRVEDRAKRVVAVPPEGRQEAVHGLVGPAPRPQARVARPVVAQPARPASVRESLLEGEAESVERDRMKSQRRESRMREREVQADVADQGRHVARRPPVPGELKFADDLADPAAGACAVGDLEHGIRGRRVMAISVHHEALDLLEIEVGLVLRVHVSLRNQESSAPASAGWCSRWRIHVLLLIVSIVSSAYAL